MTEPERRAVRARIYALRRRGGRARTVWMPVSAGIIGVLWLWTVLASDAPWPIVSAFWLIVGGGIALWARRDLRKDAGRLDDMATALQSALTANSADVYDVRAKRFAEVEEVDDEGACYAFEIDGPRVVFIVGQEFYPAARFPSLDFSLVYVRDAAGNPLDMLIEKRGARARPALTIPAATAKQIERPEHLEVRSGTIEAAYPSIT